jgi:hypothetical protein
MSISKQKRARRAEMAALRRIKCFKHKVPNCDNRLCRREVVAAFFGTYKKGKGLGQVQASPADLDRLFYLIKHPQPVDNDFPAIIYESGPSLAPVSPAPLLAPPAVVLDPRKLTLRQQYELSKSAA